MRPLLPPGFADLEPFAVTWCLPTESERFAQRMRSTMADLMEFYDAAFGRLEEAIEHCDQYPLDAMPPEAERLLQLVYSVVMAAMAVEIFAQPKTVDAADAVLDRVKEPMP